MLLYTFSFNFEQYFYLALSIGIQVLLIGLEAWVLITQVPF